MRLRLWLFEFSPTGSITEKQSPSRACPSPLHEFMGQRSGTAGSSGTPSNRLGGEAQDGWVSPRVVAPRLAQLRVVVP